MPPPQISSVSRCPASSKLNRFPMPAATPGAAIAVRPQGHTLHGNNKGWITWKRRSEISWVAPAAPNQHGMVRGHPDATQEHQLRVSFRVRVICLPDASHAAVLACRRADLVTLGTETAVTHIAVSVGHRCVLCDARSPMGRVPARCHAHAQIGGRRQRKPTWSHPSKCSVSFDHRRIECELRAGTPPHRTTSVCD